MKKIFLAVAVLLMTTGAWAGEITKEVVVDRMEILEDGQVQVRTATKILEDGKEISRTYHRHVVNPGDDYSKEVSQRVKDVCGAVHSQSVINAYKAKTSSGPGMQ